MRQPIIELPLFVSRKEQTMDNSVRFPHMGTVRSVRAGRRILVNLDSLAKYLDAGDPPNPKAALPGISRIKQ